MFFPFQAGRPTEQMGHGFPWLPMKHLSSEARTPEQQGVGAAAFVDEWSTPLSCLCRSVIWSLPWGYAKEHYPRLENENAEVSIEYGGLDLTRTLWNWQRALIIFQSKPEPVFLKMGSHGFHMFHHLCKVFVQTPSAMMTSCEFPAKSRTYLYLPIVYS